MLIVLVCFLGLISGYFLSFIAPEELKPGYKYIVIFQNILLSISIAILVASSFDNIVNSIGAAILCSVAIFYMTIKKDISARLYIFLGLPLFFMEGNELALYSSLVFILGVAIASLHAESFVKNEKINDKKNLFLSLMKKHWLFLVIGLLPFLFSYF